MPCLFPSPTSSIQLGTHTLLFCKHSSQYILDFASNFCISEISMRFQVVGSPNHHSGFYPNATALPQVTPTKHDVVLDHFNHLILFLWKSCSCIAFLICWMFIIYPPSVENSLKDLLAVWLSLIQGYSNTYFQGLAAYISKPIAF